MSGGKYVPDSAKGTSDCTSQKISGSNWWNNNFVNGIVTTSTQPCFSGQTHFAKTTSDDYHAKLYYKNQTSLTGSCPDGFTLVQATKTKSYCKPPASYISAFKALKGGACTNIASFNNNDTSYRSQWTSDTTCATPWTNTSTLNVGQTASGSAATSIPQGTCPSYTTLKSTKKENADGSYTCNVFAFGESTVQKYHTYCTSKGGIFSSKPSNEGGYNMSCTIKP